MIPLSNESLFFIHFKMSSVVENLDETQKCLLDMSMTLNMMTHSVDMIKSWDEEGKLSMLTKDMSARIHFLHQKINDLAKIIKK